MVAVTNIKCAVVVVTNIKCAVVVDIAFKKYYFNYHN